jgi:hypothetical protein
VTAMAAAIARDAAAAHQPNATNERPDGSFEMGRMDLSSG